MLEAGGLRRRVEAREGDRVSFEVLGLEEHHTVSLTAWRLWSKSALVHRDLKPENVTLSPRDVAYLAAVGQLAENGWCQCPRGRRLDVSGLSWGSWRGAEASAKARGHVDLEAGENAKGEANRVRLTAQGVEALTQHRATTQGQHRSPAQANTPPGNDPSSSPERTLREREPTKAARPAQGGQHRSAKPPSGRALDRLASAMERMAASFELLALANVERCGCGRVKERAPKKDPPGWFMRCPAWKTCAEWRAKAPRAESEHLEGPRVSPRRSEEERRARADARARVRALTPEEGAARGDLSTMTPALWQEHLQRTADALKSPEPPSRARATLERA